jgi:hypothetical protein
LLAQFLPVNNATYARLFISRAVPNVKLKVRGGYTFRAAPMAFKQYSQNLPWVSCGTLVLSLFAANLTAAATVSPSSGTIVIGFVGGFVRHDNSIHREVQLVTRLREEYPAYMQARIFENRQGRQAHQEVLQLLDADHNGKLSDEEKRAARIVLYGHSWGASEAITTARSLEKDGIPVLLTIQVDSVSKFGEDDQLIPANVAQAVNFYQINGFLHGRRKILAVNRFRTEILGNFLFDYKTKQIKCDQFPWYAQIFMKPHIEIESDPAVWNQVEFLIRSKLPPLTSTSAN